MRYYMAFDDTDTKDCGYGTGKFTREYIPTLPKDWIMYGIVRQQYPQSESIPFTSNNSSATVILEHPQAGREQELAEHGAAYIAGRYLEGSDPGLCVCAAENLVALEHLSTFGLRCCKEIVTQDEAYQAAAKAHLSAHGGTGDGVIGAAAGVGLTHLGNSGRFVQLGACDVREFKDVVLAGELYEFGISCVSVDRFDMPIHPNDCVITWGRVRPRLVAGKPVMFVTPAERGKWMVAGLPESRFIKLPE
jgi:Predicted DNA-binding protein containing a Zn-ribbon domain